MLLIPLCQLIVSQHIRDSCTQGFIDLACHCSVKSYSHIRLFTPSLICSFSKQAFTIMYLMPSSKWGHENKNRPQPCTQVEKLYTVSLPCTGKQAFLSWVWPFICLVPHFVDFFSHVVLLGVIFISYLVRKQSIITRSAKFPWKWRLFFFKLWPMLKITLYLKIQTEPGKMAQWLSSLALQSWNLDPSTCVTSRSSQHLCYKWVIPANICKPQSERGGRRVSGTHPL